MNREIESNQAALSGEIVSNFELSHEIYGEGFYTAMLASERTSGQKDIIPVMVSDRLVDVKADWIGRIVRVSGQFRSYNKHEGEKNRLILSVFVREFEEMEFENGIPNAPDGNSIFLDGYICKQPIYRKTPLGREIADILLAANRPYGKADYIPCVAWGRNAIFASGLEVGTRLQIEGRIQSREYQKRISDDEFELRVVYEVSIAKMETVQRLGGGISNRYDLHTLL
jgi:Single-stranded DNA-binding protein